MGWKNHEYVLGTDAEKAGLTANFGEGRWTATRHDVIAKETHILVTDATGRFVFDAPASRAVLFHFKNQPSQ